MAKSFPDILALRGNTILMECDAFDLPVVGALPDGLFGTLNCNGPNPQDAPRDEHHH